jgi:Wzt C-terminal domain
VLLLDEVFAVGDEAFQQKCYAKIWEFKRSGGTIVFVSHDPAAVENVCERAILLEHGRCVESGPAGEVVRAYHRRLVGEAAASVAHRDRNGTGRCRIHEVRAVAGDGAVRDRFTEGEPVALEVWLYADEGLEGGRVTVGIRDSSGSGLGSQRADSVRLRPGTLERLRLHFPGLPVREGRFTVDVVVGTQDGDAELAYAERALELSVFSQDTSGGGTVRLGGTWELPSGEDDPAA